MIAKDVKKDLTAFVLIDEMAEYIDSMISIGLTYAPKLKDALTRSLKRF